MVLVGLGDGAALTRWRRRTSGFDEMKDEIREGDGVVRIGKSGQLEHGGFGAPSVVIGASDGFAVGGVGTVTFSAFQWYQYGILSPPESLCGVLSSDARNLIIAVQDSSDAAALRIHLADQMKSD